MAVARSMSSASFPDSDCASGRRYGSLAPPNLDGECVDEDVVSTESGSTDGSDSGSGGNRVRGHALGYPIERALRKRQLESSYDRRRDHSPAF